MGVEVHSYSIEKLVDLLVEFSDTRASVFNQSGHAVYFKSYFKHLNAKTIVVEREFVDKYFLEDYSGYYVKCRRNYSRLCVRLHFFCEAFSAEQLDGFLHGNQSLSLSTLQTGYLGYIVARPVPEVVGRTCLVTYGASPESDRHYPIIRNYDNALYGIPLPIKSISFQSQDRIASTCATSALWSAFQGTGIIFHHRTPSPYEITQSALEGLPHEGPTFPNTNGLKPVEMAQAIRKIGLIPTLTRITDNQSLRRAVYGYVAGGVPVVLGLVLYRIEGTKLVKHDGHAVTITGFNLSPVSPAVKADTSTEYPLKMTADRIEKLYVHDDQIGPFAKMTLSNGQFEFEDKENENRNKEEDQKVEDVHYLTTSWFSGGEGIAVPKLLIAPLDPTIRITYERVHDMLKSTQALFSEVLNGSDCFREFEMVWDLKLTESAEVKRRIRELPPEQTFSDNRLDTLLACMPRFVWLATAYVAGKEALDVIFDTTDLQQGLVVIAAVARNTSEGYLIQWMSTELFAKDHIRDEPAGPIIECIARIPALVSP